MNVMSQSEPLTSFVPDADNTRLLRDAFGRFVTGVTIVTAMTDDGPIGITANSFSSVSLDPAMVLWAPDKKSRRAEHFIDAKHYAIHILSADQADLCWAIAKDAYGLRDKGLPTNANSVPLIEESLARFECTQTLTVDAGDHTLILGKVDLATMRPDGEALGFFKGKMGVFSTND